MSANTNAERPVKMYAQKKPEFVSTQHKTLKLGKNTSYGAIHRRKKHKVIEFTL